MKKGFTLIELLAVIVILAVIALIATPIILNIIEDSRKQSIKSSAELYVDGLVKQIATKNLTNEFNPSSCTVSNGNVTCDGTSLSYEINGKKPISGSITFNNGVVTGYLLDFGDYTVTKDQNGISIAASVPIEFNGTKVAATQSDTHKGIVYLDPTDLSTTCNAQLAAANLNDAVTPTPTGITSGCMRFYIYDDSGSTYKMILDHNTTVAVPWISSEDFFEAHGNYVSGGIGGVDISEGSITVDRQLALDTEGWVGNPRLITATEIAHITGADKSDTLKWDVSKNYINWISANSVDTDTQVSFYFFDGSGSNYSGWSYSVSPDNTGISDYGWLTEYTWSCCGCEAEDPNDYEDLEEENSHQNVHGYWTSDYVTGSDHNDEAWLVELEALISNLHIINRYNIGVRPVIELSKSVVD